MTSNEAAKQLNAAKQLRRRNRGQEGVSEDRKIRGQEGVEAAKQLGSEAAKWEDQRAGGR